MRLILLIIFLCVFFENVSSKQLDKFYLNKFLKVGLTLRKLKMHKNEIKLQRKLQEVEHTDTITSDDAEASNYPISPNATENDPVTTANKTAYVQIVRFYYIQVVVKKITFGAHFYYYKRRISSLVIFSLNIYYNSKLRTLQDDTSLESESVSATCFLKDPSLNNTYADGKKVDYSCNATSSNNSELSNITVNRDIPIQIKNDTSGKYETVDFRDINFNGLAAIQADNLRSATNNISAEYVLKEGEITDYGNTYLKIKGTLEPSKKMGISSIPITVIDSDGTPKTYTCQINQISDSEVELNCNINRELNISAYLLEGSNGLETTTNTTLEIHMKNFENNNTMIYMNGIDDNTIRYRTHSSGLSGASIAGIVIACVVVLVAASVAAILLKRPKHNKEEDNNTTVVGLKTVEI